MNWYSTAVITPIDPNVNAKVDTGESIQDLIACTESNLKSNWTADYDSLKTRLECSSAVAAQRNRLHYILAIL